MEDQILIFGESEQPQRVRKGFHLSINFKHGNAYISTELKNKLFGEKVTEAKILLVCSQIENNWYLAPSNDYKGYTCRLNDPKIATSMRINGAQKVLERMAKSMNIDLNDKKIVFSVSKANITRLEELRDITQAFYDNGMAMEVDVKRVNINLENLKVQHDNAQAMMEQQLNLLKYIIDYPAEENIALVPVNTEMITPAALTGLSETLYELQLLQSQKQLAEQQKTIVSNGYIPSLSLTGSWMFSAYTDKAYHWFHSGPSNHWYRSYGVGLSLRIPIFDGLDKRYKMRKATIDIENIKLAQENTRKNLQTQYLNATNDLMNSQRNFKKQKDNYLLAEDVYTVTMDRYREGIASMTEVLQDEMRMSEAQNNYISAHYNYRITNLTLLKLTGQLETLSPSIP